MSSTNTACPADRASRLLDIVIASAGLVVFSPVMLLIAIAILLESGRPVFFCQTRLGRHGQLFRICKFRKFRTKRDKAGLPLTRINDDRMSRIGHFLAKTKLDELPQFLNVLRGEMAIVGPRPESLDFADCFTQPYRAVLDYRPGIFGPSQVAFRNEAAFFPADADPVLFYRDVLFPMKAGVDLLYYPRRTMSSDLAWMFRGLLAVAGVPSGVMHAASRMIEEAREQVSGPQGMGELRLSPNVRRIPPLAQPH